MHARTESEFNTRNFDNAAVENDAVAIVPEETPHVVVL